VEAGNALKIAGKLAFYASAGYVATEAAKDTFNLNRGLYQGQVDKQALKNVLYAPTDLFLGRGSSQAIVETCGKGVGSCYQGARKMVGDVVDVVKDSGKSCYQSGAVGCAKDAGVLLGHTANGAKNWALNTKTFFADAYKSHEERQNHCKQVANRAECEEENRIYWKTLRNAFK
jgi:hypothetical protein